MRGSRIVWILVGLSCLTFAGVFLIHGFTESATRLNVRLSARFSFLSFCIAFAASSVQYFTRNEFGFWMLANRKFFGVSFGIIHLIHLSLLGLLQTSFYPVFDEKGMITLLGGGTAYLFVVVMLITSFESIKKKMSFKIWKFVHTVGMYWIAVVFLTSYGSRSTTEWEYIPLLSILLGCFAIRFMKVIKTKT